MVRSNPFRQGRAATTGRWMTGAPCRTACSSPSIRNFRVFDELSIDSLSRVNLIAGRNNAGKTSLLEGCPEGGTRRWRSIERHSRTGFARIRLTGDVARNITGNRCSPLDTGSSGVHAERGALARWSGQPLSSFRNLGISGRFDGSRPEVGARPTANLLTRAWPAGLAAEDHRAAFMKIPPAASHDLGRHRPARIVPLAVMGEGMTRLHGWRWPSPTVPGGLVLVDEIETGLHHSVLVDVWRAVDEAAAVRQVVATTHSYECIEAAHRALGDGDGFLLPRGKGNRVTYSPESIDAAMRHELEVR